jgi:hypothetical protein
VQIASVDHASIASSRPNERLATVVHCDLGKRAHRSIIPMLMSTPIQRSTASFAQAHTGAASIFRNELNACFFKGCYELLGGFNTATNCPIL